MTSLVLLYSCQTADAICVCRHFTISVDRSELRLCLQRMFLYGTVWNCADNLAAAKKTMVERGQDTTAVSRDLLHLYAHMEHLHRDIQEVLSLLGFKIGHCADFCCLVVEDEMD